VIAVLPDQRTQVGHSAIVGKQIGQAVGRSCTAGGTPAKDRDGVVNPAKLEEKTHNLFDRISVDVVVAVLAEKADSVVGPAGAHE
jgi:hypothetical protein